MNGNCPHCGALGEPGKACPACGGYIPTKAEVAATLAHLHATNRALWAAAHTALLTHAGVRFAFDVARRRPVLIETYD